MCLKGNNFYEYSLQWIPFVITEWRTEQLDTSYTYKSIKIILGPPNHCTILCIALTQYTFVPDLGQQILTQSTQLSISNDIKIKLSRVPCMWKKCNLIKSCGIKINNKDSLVWNLNVSYTQYFQNYLLCELHQRNYSFLVLQKQQNQDTKSSQSYNCSYA